jgi:hypothetical protein
MGCTFVGESKSSQGPVAVLVLSDGRPRRSCYKLLHFAEGDHQGLVLVFTALALGEMNSNNLQRFGYIGAVKLGLGELVQEFQTPVAAQRIVFRCNGKFD